MDNKLYDERFTLRDDDVFRGLIPQVNKISDREINELIQRFREIVPHDKRTDEELRPFAVNTILGGRYHQGTDQIN
jgi:hypothetical protein